MRRTRFGIRLALQCSMALWTLGGCAPAASDSEDTAAATVASSDTSTASAGDTLVALPVPDVARRDSAMRDSVRRDSIRGAAMRPRVPRPDATVRVPPVRDPAAGPDTAPRTVQGRVELQIDAKTFTPGDYLRVRLIAPGTTRETWTNRNGEFSFEDAPANASELLFLTGDKLELVVYRQHVRIGAGPVVRLPVVHIPIDSIKRRAAGS